MILSSRTSQSWTLPGLAQPRFTTRSRSASSDMGEDIDLRPAGEVEHRPVRQEVEAGAGEAGPALPLEPFVQSLLQLVEVANVGGGIILLRVRKLRRSPVGALLLLGDVDLQKLLDQLLEAVAVGIGSDQPRGGLGAIDRLRHHPEIGAHDGEIEAGEMVELEPRRVGQHRLEVGCRVIALRAEADEMLVAAAVRNLHEAQPRAARKEAHRLGIDGDGPGGEDALGQILFVEMDGHEGEIGRSAARLNGRATAPSAAEQAYSAPRPPPRRSSQRRYSPWARARRSRLRSAPRRSSAGTPGPASPRWDC